MVKLSRSLPLKVPSNLTLPVLPRTWSTSQLQETLPDSSAVLSIKPGAVLFSPVGRVTTTEQTTPGDVFARMLALVPGPSAPVTNTIDVLGGDDVTIDGSATALK